MRHELGLMEGRHALPVEDYVLPSNIVKSKVFNKALEEMDLDKIQDLICQSLANYARNKGIAVYREMPIEGSNGEWEMVYAFPKNQQVTLYVTGLTPVLIEALEVLKDYGASVTLMHYDRNSQNYVSRKLR